MDTSLKEERSADYQTYEVSGSHHEMGLASARHGQQLFGAPTEWGKPQREYAEKCRSVVEKWYPEMIEEFQGYAEASGMREEEILWHFTLGVTGGCSGIAVRTPQGMLAGRNYDFFYWENRRHLIHTRPNKGFAQIGMHEGLVGGRFDGLNDKGLFISFNGAGPHPDPAQPGMSFHLIVRYVLERCADVQEAQEALMTLPVKEPKSYLAVDRRDAIVVEIHPENRAVRRMEGDVLVVTNHFLHPSMTPYMREWPNSGARYRKMEEQGARLVKETTTQPMDGLRLAFADHEAPVCGHEDGLATFWSCAADIENQRILYSLGAPCRNEYKEYFAF
jgi:predicted choloylglycine hydrolase